MKCAGERQTDEILLYIPNLIGYARLCLLVLAYFCIQLPAYFLILLDVIVDNISRSCIWTNVCSWGWIIVSIEWVTFVCNHQAGSKWRDASSKARPVISVAPPRWVLKIMENGFKTPLGTWVILGLHSLPVWIYAMQHGLIDLFISYSTSLVVLLLLLMGRIVCLGCELWCIKKHIIELLNEDVNS